MLQNYSLYQIFLQINKWFEKELVKAYGLMDLGQCKKFPQTERADIDKDLGEDEETNFGLGGITLCLHRVIIMQNNNNDPAKHCIGWDITIID